MGEGYVGIRLTLSDDPRLWTQLARKLTLQLKSVFLVRDSSARPQEHSRFQCVLTNRHFVDQGHR